MTLRDRGEQGSAGGSLRPGQGRVQGLKLDGITSMGSRCSDGTERVPACQAGGHQAADCSVGTWEGAVLVQVLVPCSGPRAPPPGPVPRYAGLRAGRRRRRGAPSLC